MAGWQGSSHVDGAGRMIPETQAKILKLTGQKHLYNSKGASAAENGLLPR